MNEKKEKIINYKTILLLIVVVFSIIQTVYLFASMEKLDSIGINKETTEGKVRLYVTPQPISEEAKVRLNVVKEGGNKNEWNIG